MIVDEVLEDIGSGLNYNRKKWNKLIVECTLGFVLLSKETGVIVEKYSVAIKKKTECTF